MPLASHIHRGWETKQAGLAVLLWRAAGLTALEAGQRLGALGGGALQLGVVQSQQVQVCHRQLQQPAGTISPLSDGDIIEQESHAYDMTCSCV